MNSDQWVLGISWLVNSLKYYLNLIILYKRAKIKQRRDAGEAERGRLEIDWAVNPAPGVQIPLSPPVEN